MPTCIGADRHAHSPAINARTMQAKLRRFEGALFVAGGGPEKAGSGAMPECSSVSVLIALIPSLFKGSMK